MKKITFLKNAWRLVKPYWFSEEKWIGRGLLTLIVGLDLGGVYLIVLLNSWYKGFYDSLQEKNYANFKAALIQFGILASIFILTAGYKLYLQQMLEIRWRRWLTKSFLFKWLSNKSYYHLEIESYGADNPDQRIAEDLKILSGGTLNLALGLLSSTVTLVSFFMILWNISGPISFTVFGEHITIEGYMVWAAFGYAFLGSIITHYIARSLIPLYFQQQKFEANFRFGLIRIREYAEAIALYRGERQEKVQLDDHFDRIWKNWWPIMKYQKRRTWFTSAYGQVASVFPLIVAAPRYFSGAIELGTLMQIASAFGRVQDALSWFIDSYGPITEWKASLDRLTQFEEAISRAQETNQRSKIVRVASSDLLTEHLRIQIPDGRVLADNVAIAIKSKEKVLIKGPSGRGKSTLFRIFAGIWPYGSGKVTTPNAEDSLYLPQKPYLPIGTLKEAITYPKPSNLNSDSEIIKLLDLLNLKSFGTLLNIKDDWSKRLSLGEQQRVALARVLLHKPKWIFLDEATASLDAENEKLVYELLSEYLPDSTIVSIAHKEDISGFHGREILI